MDCLLVMLQSIMQQAQHFKVTLGFTFMRHASPHAAETSKYHPHTVLANLSLPTVVMSHHFQPNNPVQWFSKGLAFQHVSLTSTA